ncbi:MAG: class I SAM-dependent methyltransferase [Acidobacteria bacterium]|nr:class I SAM-dependent methyltransferase [Acidobacteriota bacterium]
MNFSIFEKRSRRLPIQKVLEGAEKLALRAARQPGPEVAAALAELAPVLRAWGRREVAARIEQAPAVGPDDPALAAEITAAARELREMQERIRAAFDRDSSDEEHFPSTIDPRIYHVKLILDFFGDLSGKSALDVGCGKGRFARILHERYPEAEIWGLDISAEMLRYVPEGIHTKQGPMTDLPFPDGRFDAVYATESLEHAIEIEAAVGEMCRVTRPGGRVVIIDKNVEMTGRLETPAWEKWFGRREMERLLGRHCRQVESQFLSYWEDVAPDGLFLAWKAIR